MAWTSVPKWITRLARWRDPFKKGAQEAADQYLGKEAKMQTFHHLTMEMDLKELGETERAAVKHWREKRMGIGGPSSGSGENKDAFVCDDMTINNSRGIGLMEILLALIVAAVVWFVMKGNKTAAPDTAPPPAPVAGSPADSAYDVFFYDKDGNLIDIPRKPKTP